MSVARDFILPNMETRAASSSDAALISAHRRAMFAEMRSANESVLATLERNSVAWAERMILEDKYAGWIVEEEGHAVASAGLLILDMPPHPLDPEGVQRAHLLNVFVEPGYRRRGLARALVQICMDAARRRNIRVITLNASDAGRTLYEGLGFHTSNEMLYSDTPNIPRDEKP